MSPATFPPKLRDAVRLLAIDPRAGTLRDERFSALPRLLRAGDLLVLNDAATLPASLRGHCEQGAPIEVRLIAQLEGPRWRALLFGAGDWRTPTEERPAPPPLGVGARLDFDGLRAELIRLEPRSPRLIELRFDTAAHALWSEIYRVGRPIQYAYLEDELELWSVQTVYATRPWAVEMPSAGRAFTWRTMEALRARGVELATLTHAAGISSTGDATLDAALPLRERYELPAITVDAIARTRARGGRVVAVGTTVVRALEGAWAAGRGQLTPGVDETELVIDEAFRPRVVDGVLTGMHESAESHFRLLAAFAPRALLERSLAHAIAEGYRTHEFGDSSLYLSAA